MFGTPLPLMKISPESHGYKPPISRPHPTPSLLTSLSASPLANLPWLLLLTSVEQNLELGDDAVVLDVCCGAGTIGICAAAAGGAKRVSTARLGLLCGIDVDFQPSLTLVRSKQTFQCSCGTAVNPGVEVRVEQGCFTVSALRPGYGCVVLVAVMTAAIGLDGLIYVRVLPCFRRVAFFDRFTDRTFASRPSRTRGETRERTGSTTASSCAAR